MMNKLNRNFLSFRRWTTVLGGLLLTVFGGICFSNVSSAQTEIVETPTNRNLALGKLLYNRTNYAQFGTTGAILTANADGSGQSSAGISAILPNQPTWTADGTKILYSQGDIFVVRSGGDLNLTNTGSVTENSPACSVTGKIAYVRAFEIWTMNADGSGQAKFSAITQPGQDSPAWSPDGTTLAFVSGGEIWVINADGSNQRRVTTNATTDVDPAWSPDGFKIVFGKGSGIAVINADGTNEVAITNGFNDIQPSWSPDGTKIAFRRNSGDRGVYTMDINGGNQIRILADISPGIPNPSTVYGDPEWQPLRGARRTAFDFDGDGRSDVSVFRPSNGTWYTSTDAATNYGAIQFGAADDKPVPADYDGDGVTDIAVYRPSNGTWYLRQSTNGFAGISFGLSSDIPAPADYDGDGKADVAVFRPSTGTWYLKQSTLGFAAVQFGQAGDRPVAADYDGDGKTDIAVNRGGTWYIQRSTLGFYTLDFGYGDDKLVPADYDGDRKADIAVFRSVEGTWYIQRSTLGYFSVQYRFGFGFDIPVPADYDGDGKTDVAFVRTNTWYLERSTAGFTSVGFGVNNDKHVPNAYVR